MTDKEKNTETKVDAKPKSATKSKATSKPKVKPKAKAKPKAETKSKESTTPVAPYLKKDNKTQAESPKSKISALLILILAAAIIIPTTIYNLKQELSSLSAQPEPQENTITSKTTSVAMMQTNTDNDDVYTQPVKTQEPAANKNEIAQQHRQTYESEMQSRQQQYQATIKARRQEMASTAETQKEIIQRIRQNQLETRMKIQKMHEQIFELHEQIHQLMQESYARNRS